jgi:hypothetical protein
MALSFATQVVGLLSQTLGSSPSTTELTQFLIDGVKDVTNRIIQIRPDMASLFATTITLDGSPSTVTVDSGVVLNVWRENGTASQLEGASEIDAANRHRATDTESLFYRSKFNPGWYWAGNIVNVVPAPSSSGDEATVKYVGYDETIAHGSTTIVDFPNQYEHLVVLYAAIQSVMAYLSSIEDSLPEDLALPVIPTVPTISTISASAPVAPVLSTSSVTFAESTTYTAPVISLPAFPTLTWDLPSAPIAPALSSNAIGSLGTVPTYTPPVSSPDIAGIDTYATDDDPELAGVIRDKANVQISKYQVDIQNELNKFNKENSIYQSTVQKALQDAEMESKDENQALQKFANEVQLYTTEINKVVTSNQSQFSEWQVESALLVQKYQAELQNSVNEFSKTQTEYQGELQRATQEAQLVSADDSQKIQNYSSEVQEYTASIGKDSQDNQNKLTKYTAEAQAYSANATSELSNYSSRIQKQNTRYQWVQSQYGSLKQQYNEAFGLMAPPKQEQRR